MGRADDDDVEVLSLGEPGEDPRWRTAAVCAGLDIDARELLPCLLEQRLGFMGFLLWQQGVFHRKGTCEEDGDHQRARILLGCRQDSGELQRIAATVVAVKGDQQAHGLARL